MPRRHIKTLPSPESNNSGRVGRSGFLEARYLGNGSREAERGRPIWYIREVVRASLVRLPTEWRFIAMSFVGDLTMDLKSTTGVGYLTTVFTATCPYRIDGTPRFFPGAPGPLPPPGAFGAACAQAAAPELLAAAGCLCCAAANAGLQREVGGACDPRPAVNQNLCNHRCPFWLVWLKNRGLWFTLKVNHLPGPSIFFQKDTYVTTMAPC